MKTRHCNVCEKPTHDMTAAPILPAENDRKKKSPGLKTSQIRQKRAIISQLYPPKEADSKKSAIVCKFLIMM